MEVSFKAQFEYLSNKFFILKTTKKTAKRAFNTFKYF